MALTYREVDTQAATARPVPASAPSASFGAVSKRRSLALLGPESDSKLIHKKSHKCTVGENPGNFQREAFTK